MTDHDDGEDVMGGENAASVRVPVAVVADLIDAWIDFCRTETVPAQEVVAYHIAVLQEATEGAANAESERDCLYLDLNGARERLCRAQTHLPLPQQRTLLQEALDRIDRVGVFLPQWSNFDEPPIDGSERT